MATVPKRELTEEEKADAARLRAAWEAFKQRTPGASQAWLGKATGLGTQGLIGQYLGGVIQLNLVALISICIEIGANPIEISPRLAERLLPLFSAPAGWEKLNASQREQVESFVGWLLERTPQPPEDQPSEKKRFGKGA